jgi:xylulokinase
VFLGIDFGTSAVKALLVDGSQTVVGSASAALSVQRPAAGHSEQDPQAWWQAMLDAVDALGREHAGALSAVVGIGLSGQMHGAVLLDAAGAVLRPAILWNDVRAAAECAELEAAVPDLRQVTGNIAMPGFTAPKLLWVRKHVPAVFARVRTVLLPKAYIRCRMTGEMIEEMSDASGTLWLDVDGRDWSDVMLSATGLSRGAMPRLVEGNSAAGTLRSELAARWRMARWPVLAGGAGGQCRGRGGTVGDPGGRCVRLAWDIRCAVRHHRSVPALAASGCPCILPRFAGALAPDGGYAVAGGLAGVVGWCHWPFRGGFADGGRLAGVTEPGAVPAVSGG